ncbi:MAG: class I SAM-dependent methyltransferase [Reyranella sp.]|nr:class I SAM-dependent methyltransferase [Reyranella sp.]
MTSDVCPACGSNRSEILSLPGAARSITSGGILLDMPLGRLHCLACGLLRQKPHDATLKAELYREKYGLYHRRSGTAKSEARRYADIADWIFGTLAPFVPASVLDIGCGGGLLLDALRRIHPEIRYAGVEPSRENSDLARDRGFEVTTDFVPGARPVGAPFDLVLCSNVLSHVPAARAFLEEMAAMTTPAGRVLVYSHDGRKPGADMLWADIDYSLCREHVAAIGAQAGLEALPNTRGAPPLLQHDKMVVAFRRNAAPATVPWPTGAALEELLDARRDYLCAWQELARRLERAAATAQGPVLNFGASFWSLLLAAYCPGYWSMVKACVVDGELGTFLEKPMTRTSDLATRPRPLIVLGVNPALQPNVSQRLAPVGDVITWNDLIEQ